MTFNSADLQTATRSRARATSAGSRARSAAGFLVFSPVNAGTYKFSLRYSNPGSGAATFFNPGIWGGAVQ